MAFKEIRFPLNSSYGVSGGHRFFWNITTQNSGNEQRNEIARYPKGKWVVSYDARMPDQFDPIEAFFFIVHGPGYGFRFRDVGNYQVTQANGIIALLPGSTTVGQLYKKYTFGSETYYLRIQKPALAEGGVAKTALYKDAVQLTYGAGSTQVVFDESKGLVTFNTAPGASVLTWAGDFDFPCRLDLDWFRREIIDANGHNYIKGVRDIVIVEDPV